MVRRRLRVFGAPGGAAGIVFLPGVPGGEDPLVADDEQRHCEQREGCQAHEAAPAAADVVGGGVLGGGEAAFGAGPAGVGASARRRQLPASGGAVPAHGRLAVAAGPLWRAGDLSPPAGIARRLLRSKGRGVWSPAVRQLGAAGAGELPWCGDRAPGWGGDAARPGARVCDVSLRADGSGQAAAF